MHTKNKHFVFDKQNDFLFLSMNLYRGIISSFNSNYHDFDKAKKEIIIIEKILSKIRHKIDYKPYVTENLRYPDEDPVLDILQKHKRINLLNEIIDARFIISDYKAFIIQGASSTLSWIILTEKPVIFINDKTLSSI